MDKAGTSRFGSIPRSQNRLNKRTLLLLSSEDIYVATDGYNKKNLIHVDKLEKYYKGELRGNKVIVKVWNIEMDPDLNKKFMREIEILAQLDHKHIVKVIGAHFETHTIIYDNFSDNDMEYFLKERPKLMTWEMRTRIMYQLCTTLMYLHSRPQPVVHGFVHPTTVHLDEYYNAKLVYFGRSYTLPPGPASEVFLQVNKYYGYEHYVDPDYKMGKVMVGCDTHPFGVTILKILTNKDPKGLIKKMTEAYENKKVMELVDREAGEWPEYVAKFLAKFGVLCCTAPSSDKLEVIRELSVKLLETLNHFGIPTQVGEEAIISLETLSMLDIKLFNEQEIELATGSYVLQLGQGGFGTVFKGLIDDDKVEVAIKILHSDDNRAMSEFRQEVQILGTLKHENLLRLLGVCLEPMCLVYEFIPRGSVEHCLRSNPGNLNWKMRIRILDQTCSALMFLHSTKPKSIVHGDLKPDNVLLDAQYNAKLADFGLSRILLGSTVSRAFHETKVAKGTDCYIDPDYLNQKKLTPSCDVYSFGVMILKLLIAEGPHGIIKKVKRAYKKKTLMSLVDGKAGDWPEPVAETIAYYGLMCCDEMRYKWAETLQEISTEFKRILDIVEE